MRRILVASVLLALLSSPVAAQAANIDLKDLPPGTTEPPAAQAATKRAPVAKKPAVVRTKFRPASTGTTAVPTKPTPIRTQPQPPPVKPLKPAKPASPAPAVTSDATVPSKAQPGPSKTSRPAASQSPAPTPVAAPIDTAPSWASAEIEDVVSAGALGTSVATFRPQDPLTQRELYDAFRALGFEAALPARPDAPVRLRELDAKLVAAAGMLDEARRIRHEAGRAGLAPLSSVGTETVARLLGLRINHPQGQEELELGPNEPATRAEAAFSLARLRALEDWEVDGVRSAVSRFNLPVFTGWQQRILQRGIRFVGQPYVWTGTSEKPQQLGEVMQHGGFDCSGLVWRIYKTEPYEGFPALANTLQGRTTFSMSAEMPAASRIPRQRLQPADIMFFGDNGQASSPLQVGHAGIYVGGGWFLHSSRNGVTLQPFEGWYDERFAWARRPLAEAGLL